MEIPELLATLEGRFALGLKPAEREALAAKPPAERHAPLLALAGEAVRRVLWIQAALWLEKPDYDGDLGMLLAAALSEPGPFPALKASARLAEARREQFARAFGLKFEGANLSPLYVRKFVSLVDEVLAQAVTVTTPEGAAAALALDDRLQELIHFLGSTFVASVIQARYNAAGALAAKVLFGAPLESFRSLKGLGNYQAGVFLAGPDGAITSLQPFFLYGDRPAGAGERLKAWRFESYRDGRLEYHTLREGDAVRHADGEQQAQWAQFFTRLGSLHRAWVILQELPDDSRALAQLRAAVGHALKARQHRAAGQHARAVGELDLAIKARGDIPAFYFMAAEACVKGSDLRAAAAIYNRLLEQFPACERGYLAYGEALELRGDLPKAIRAYDKVLAINPHSAEGVQRRKRAEERLRAGESDQAAGGAAPAGAPGEGRPLVREFLQDLTAQAEQGKLPGRLGGEEPLRQLIEILCCAERNSALVLGDPGVGKSNLVEALVQRMLAGEAPPKLQGRRVLMMSVATLIAGAKFRGQFEERMLALVEEIKRQDALLVIDHLHTLVASGMARGGSLDAASLLKPALGRGEIQVIGLSGHEDFTAVLEKDPALMRALQIIRLGEPGAREARVIARYCAPRYERFHDVRIGDDAIREAIALARLNLKERALPDSALQILDRAAAGAALAGEREVGRGQVARTVAAVTGVAVEKLRLGSGARLARIETRLRRRVRGQDEALSTVSRVLRTTRLGFKTHPRRPEGVFLFAGPTGVGKTELSRAVAAALLGDENKLIRIDMSEYMERINAARLIGTAPGYVGYNDPNQLTDQVRKNPFAVVLFDEIEKADASVLNLFLQIFDAGRLTDGRGRAVAFNHATIIMTSNVGTHLFARKRLGLDDAPRKVTREAMLKEIRQHFPAEFLNRVDEIVVFDPLGAEAIREIIELQLAPVHRRLKGDGKRLSLEPAALDWIAREGYSFEYGARNLARVLRREILDPLAALALGNSWAAIGALRVAVEDDRLVLKTARRESEPEPAVALAEPSLVAEEPGEGEE